MAKNNLIKISEYLSNIKAEKNEVTIKVNEENVKIYFVKHLVE